MSKDIVSTSKPLELLHIDLFGPVNTASIYESKYGLVIVDDSVDGVGLSFLNLKMTHMMCLANSTFKSNLKKS